MTQESDYKTITMTSIKEVVPTIQDIAADEADDPVRLRYQDAVGLIPNLTTTILVSELCAKVCELESRIAELESQNRA